MLFSEWTRQDKSLNIVSVGQLLLNFCQRNRDQFRDEISDFDSRKAKSRLRAWVRCLFQDDRNSTELEPWVLLILDLLIFHDLNSVGRSLPKRTRKKLRKIAVENSNLFDELSNLDVTDSAEVVKARAVAWALDDALKEKFLTAFENLHKGKGVITLEPGDAFPSPLPRNAFPNPSFRITVSDDSTSHLPNLRIWPDDIGIRVEIAIRDPFTLALNELNNRTTNMNSFSVGCVGPVNFNEMSAYYAVPNNASKHRYKSYECPPEENGFNGMSTFFGVKPTERFLPRGTLVDLLKLAENENSSVCVFPELCLDKNRLQSLTRAIAGVDRPILVVAGSMHQTGEDAGQKNRLHLFVKNELDVTNGNHDKVGTFSFKETRRDEKLQLYEDIQRSSTIRIYLTDLGPCCFLICKDVLQQTVLDALNAIGVRLLFVSALSPKTEEFLVHLSELAVRNNTVSVLSCSAPSPETAAALIGPDRQFTVNAVPYLKLLDAQPNSGGASFGLATFRVAKNSQPTVDLGFV